MSSLFPFEQPISGARLLEDVVRLARDPTVRRNLAAARLEARQQPEVVGRLVTYFGTGVRLLQS